MAAPRRRARARPRAATSEPAAGRGGSRTCRQGSGPDSHAEPRKAIDALRPLPCGRAGAGRGRRRRRRAWSAGPCATCCWGGARASSTWSSRATSTAAAARSAGPSTAHERFGTASVRAGGCAFDLARARRETYARPGRCPTCARRRWRRTSRAATSPSTRWRSASPARCGRVAGRARGPRRRRPAGAARPRPSPTTRRGCGASPLRRAAGVRGRAADARAGRRGRPGDGERRPPRAPSCAWPCASPTRSPRCAPRATPPAAARPGFDPDPPGLSALALLPPEGRRDLVAGGLRARAGLRARSWLARRPGLRRAPTATSSAPPPGSSTGAPLRAARTPRGDRAGGPGRPGGGRRAGRRRQRPALDGGAPPCGPRDHRRRPAHRGVRAAPRSASACAGPSIASSTGGSHGRERPRSTRPRSTALADGSTSVAAQR